MATSKMCTQKNKGETFEWTELFLNNAKNKQDSLNFMKRMMAVAVSTITYVRGIFPESAYKSKYVEDLCIKVLREDGKATGASKVVKWMMGCFDALEKQYLQSVFIGVYTNPDQPNCIIESYQFKLKYTEMDIIRSDVQVQVVLEDTKTASTLLIRKLFLLMQNLGSLPNNVYLTMKLYYFDDITPPDYQPPGFKEGESDNLWFEGSAVHFKVGDVQTGFHSLRVHVWAAQSKLEKLQEGNHQREMKQLMQKNQPENKNIKDSHKKLPEEDDLPSEDESAQFKKCRRSMRKRQSAAKNVAKKRKV